MSKIRLKVGCSLIEKVIFIAVQSVLLLNNERRDDKYCTNNSKLCLE